MKTKKELWVMTGLLWAVMAIAVTACQEAEDGDYDFREMAEPSGYSMSDGGGSGGNTQAGIVTAGEWCDLEHWAFWSKLMLGQEFAEKSDYWQFYTNNRVAVEVTDATGNAVAGAPVKLLRNNKTVWEAVTDNHGRANCWVGLFQQETATGEGLAVSIGGQVMERQPVICRWDSLQGADAETALLDNALVNHYVVARPTALKQQADIAFVVDATGSMGDEINFLKSDLEDIIGKAAAVHPHIKMRTAALFYRDEGDDYLTRHSDFTEKLSETAAFVGKQRADGGGDYPEAVHSALEHMLQDLSWNMQARTRLAFLILDAPAHYKENVIRSLQQSVALCAQLGIRLVPVAASGADKNTEFMLRFFAIATGGTYVFLTNDSGVGNEHMAASVGPYKVEQLNDLLIRLIDEYTE